MENKIEEIIKEVVNQYFDKLTKTITYTPENGYATSIYMGKYCEELGKKFKIQGINFQSNFDIGMCDDFLKGGRNYKENPSFASIYIKSCKITPSKNFLKGIVTEEFQKEILFKTMNFFDKKINTKASDSISKILRDYQQIGVNPILINTELTSIIMAKYRAKTNPNNILPYIYEGFFLSNEFLMKKFKPDFFDAFQASPNLKKQWDEIVDINTENQIKYSHEKMERDLPEENKAAKKIKL